MPRRTTRTFYRKETAAAREKGAGAACDGLAKAVQKVWTNADMDLRISGRRNGHRRKNRDCRRDGNEQRANGDLPA